MLLHYFILALISEQKLTVSRTFVYRSDGRSRHVVGTISQGGRVVEAPNSLS